jgi:hypothetical protein
MRPFFSSDGGIGATVLVARGRPAAAACLALVREEEDDGWFGCDGGLGRPGGRGPVGGGGKIGRLKKKRMGRGWDERPDGPKAKEIHFRIKFVFPDGLWKFAQ